MSAAVPAIEIPSEASAALGAGDLAELHTDVCETLRHVAANQARVLQAALTAGKRPAPMVHRAAAVLVGGLFVQILAGVINLLLLAPTWLQLVHLLLADLVWMALVLLIAAALGAPRMQVAGAASTGPEPSPS